MGMLRLVYLLGLFGGLGIGLTNGQVVFGIALPTLRPYLFAWGFGHMVILSFVAFGYRKSYPGIASEKAQTAGYIHTLIGVLTAFIWVGEGMDSPRQLMGPIGSALVTSIIGWVVGGEIRGPSRVDRDAVATAVLNKFILDTKRISETVKELNESYVTNLQFANKQLEESVKSHERQVKAIQEMTKILTESSSSLSESVDGIRKSFTIIHVAAGDIRENLEKARVSAKASADYFSQAKLLHENVNALLEHLMRITTSERRV